jgi:hypothetical protein
MASIQGKIQKLCITIVPSHQRINTTHPFHWLISISHSCNNLKNTWHKYKVPVKKELKMYQITNYTTNINKTKKTIFKISLMFLLVIFLRTGMQPFKVQINQSKSWIHKWSALHHSQWMWVWIIIWLAKTHIRQYMGQTYLRVQRKTIEAQKVV